MKKLRLGIVGATTLIAKELMIWLEKWQVPNNDVKLYDTKEQSGYICPCANRFLSIIEATKDMGKEQDVLIFCDENLYQNFHTDLAIDCYTINLSDYHDHEFIVIPHLNAMKLTNDHRHMYIANASLYMLASIVSIMSSLQPITSVTMTSLHSAGEFGQLGCKELQKQIEAYIANRDLESCCFPTPSSYQHLPLLFQALPQTSMFLDDGKTKEESFIEKALAYFLTETPLVNATCVRTACMRGMSMSIHMELQKEMSLDTILDAYASSSAFICFDDLTHDMYPITADVIHDYRMFIGRMRLQGTSQFNAWAVCDDLSIRCAATVQMILYIYHNFL